LAYSNFKEISQDRINEFFLKGYKKRYFFPHQIYYLPRCGPDAFKLAQRMCGVNTSEGLWEVILYASESCIDEFPGELFLAMI
jgi:hypothetical protein